MSKRSFDMYVDVKEEEEEHKTNKVVQNKRPRRLHTRWKQLLEIRSRLDLEAISRSNTDQSASQESAKDACEEKKPKVYSPVAPANLCVPSWLAIQGPLFAFPETESEGTEGRDAKQELGSPQEFGGPPFPVRMTTAMPEGFLMRMRVLVVDHDESNLSALSQMLNGFFCHVTTCLRAKEALAMLANRRISFDLVLSEAHLPTMDVFMFIEHVSLDMYVPFAVMSDDSSTSSFLDALKCGALSYLVKPIVKEELKTLIIHVSRIKLSNNYNELLQSDTTYHSGQSRQVSNPRMGKIEWKEVPSRVKYRKRRSFRSVVLPVLFLTKLRSRFGTRFKRVKKEETSGSKSYSYNELIQSTSIYQSGNLHKGKTEWKEVPSRVKSPNRKLWKEVPSRVKYPKRWSFRSVVLPVLFLTKLRSFETRFKRLKTEETSGSKSYIYNELVQSTSIYQSGNLHKGKTEWKEVPCVKSPNRKSWRSVILAVCFVIKLKRLKMSRSKTRFIEVTGKEISGPRRLRFLWTPVLHEMFINAILHLGLDDSEADPQKVMDLMDIEGLRREIVAIHLKKYHLSLKKVAHLPLSEGTSDIHRHMSPAKCQIHDNSKAKLLQDVRDAVYNEDEHQFANEPIMLRSNNVLEEYMLFGYQKEFRKLMELLGVSSRIPTNGNQARPENVSVLPLVGRGGVGKTTLALQIFNDKNVLDYFDRKYWISASDVFHGKDLIKKFIRAIAECEMESDDLGCIQRFLTDGIFDQSKRFLFIVDNIHECACNEISGEWMGSILKHTKFGSMVLLTTRSMKVADTFGTMDSFLLGGFPEVALWKFLKICAFGSDAVISNRFLEDIGKRIVEKLNGIPFAAKVLGRLLSLHLSCGFWNNILRSELWEWSEEETGICSSLLLSYLYLPSHLKQCFCFCSTYPKGYKFDKDMLVDCWAAVGLVVAHKDIPFRDIGASYFNELVNRSFFQKTPSSSKYVMNDMLHDMALVVSNSDCFMIRDKADLAIVQPNILHLSVLSNSGLGLSSLESLSRYNKLWSLVCYGVDSSIITRAAERWFHNLSEIRMLSFNSCQLNQLSESIGNLKHLRYLDISSCTFDKLPSSFWCLSKLEILYAQSCTFHHLPKDITKLTSLRRVKLNSNTINQFRYMPEVGKLGFFEELPYFDVSNEHGRSIGELKNMNHIHGSLEISGLNNVMSMYEAAEAELHKKKYLDTLILSWDESVKTCARQLITGQEIEIVEGLCPSYYLKHLGIKCYSGFELHPSWFNERLHGLSSISFNSCPNLASLPFQYTASSSNKSITRFPWLTKLFISRCRKLSDLAEFLKPDCFPAMKSIHIEKCDSLVSLPAQGFAGFVHLEELQLFECWNLNWPSDDVFPPSLKELKLEACGDISESTLGCLHNLRALTTLKLQFCHLVKSIREQTWNGLASLENLTIFYCKGLESIGGSEAVAKVQNVDISNCPYLRDLEQPFRKGNN